MTTWPATPDALLAEQRRLAAATPEPWTPPDRPLAIGGCFVCFPRGVGGAGTAGDPAWAAAAVVCEGRPIARALACGAAPAPYRPGMLALREGPLLEAAVRRLDPPPDVVLVNATGRDHPRRAGLALHLGAVLGLPSVGVTHRLLVASGHACDSAARAPIHLAGDLVGYWVMTRLRARPLAVHAGWRVSPEDAVEIVLAAGGRARTPEPLRHARRLAREARAGV